MTFNFISDAINKLNLFASKDSKYISIVEPLNELLLNLQEEFLSFNNDFIKVLDETAISRQISDKDYHKKIKSINENFIFYENKVKQKISDFYRSKEESLELINQDIKNTLDKLSEEINELSKIQNEKINKYTITKNQELSAIEKSIIDIRKDSTKSISQIENNYILEVEETQKNYKVQEAILKDSMQAFEEETVIAKSKIQNAKNAYREQSDKKYLVIKGDFYQESSTFNAKVDELKIIRQQKEKQLIEQYKIDIQPFEVKSNENETHYADQKNFLQNEYNRKIEEHNNLYNSIVEHYNLSKNHTIKETSDSVTLLNSKLSAYKEALAKERFDSAKIFKKSIVHLTESEKLTASKERNKEIRQSDNELNKQIVRTEKEIANKMRAQYDKLYELEVKFIQDITKWQTDEKVLKINFKHQNYNIYLNYQNKLKEVEIAQKKLKLTLDHSIDLLQHELLEGLLPHETHITIANLVSERDINLLSNDTNYHLSHYQFKEDTLEYKLQLFKLDFEEQLSKLKNTQEHDLNILQLNQQLGIEKETVIRDQQLSTQELKKTLILNTASMNDEVLNLSLSLKRLKIDNKINYLNKQKEILHEYYTRKTNLDIEGLTNDLSSEKEKLNFYTNLSIIEKDTEVLYKDLDIIHSRIHYFFNQIYLIYNIEHHFMKQLVKLYQLPAHPEDVKSFINLYENLFSNLKETQDEAINEFLVDVKKLNEQKINEITSDKLNSNMNDLYIVHETNLEYLNQEIKTHETNILNFSKQIDVLGQNVDRVQSEINHLENLKANEQNKKQTKFYQSEIDTLHKQIFQLEKEMSVLENEIVKLQKPIDKVMQKRTELENLLNVNINKLHLEQEKDARLYFKQLSFYQNFMKRLITLFSSYQTKSNQITAKLNQPIYLTDKIIIDAERSYQRLEYGFELTANNYYQTLITNSINFFDQLRSEKIEMKNHYEKQLSLNYESQKKYSQNLKIQKDKHAIKHNQVLSQLDDESKLNLDHLTLNLTKEKQSLINFIQDTIKSLESQIMAAENKLRSELALIDDNLKSAILEIKNEYQKSIDKNHDIYLKNQAKLIESQELKQKLILQLEDSTKFKNQSLLSKYNQSDLKQKDIMKEKQSSYKDQFTKKVSTFNKKIDTYSHDLEITYLKNNELINEDTQKSRQIALAIEKIESKRSKKEIKDAKKSYLYKKKSLNL